MPAVATMAECLDDTAAAILDAKPMGHIQHEKLDKLIGGVRPRLMIVPAAPGVGKTTFVHEIADYWALSGHPVVFFEGELSKPSLLVKSITRLTQGAVTAADMFDGDLVGEKRERFDHALGLYREQIAPQMVVCDGPIEYAAMRGAIAEAADHFGEEPLVVCDYAQIVALPQHMQSVDERIGLKLVASHLRAIVDELHCPLIAISSINRTSYDKKAAGLDAIGGCSAFEYCADVVCSLAVKGAPSERPAMMQMAARPVVASISKNRYGICGEVEFVFDALKATFNEA